MQALKLDVKVSIFAYLPRMHVFVALTCKDFRDVYRAAHGSRVTGDDSVLANVGTLEYALSHRYEPSHGALVTAAGRVDVFERLWRLRAWSYGDVEKAACKVANTRHRDVYEKLCLALCPWHADEALMRTVTNEDVDMAVLLTNADARVDSEIMKSATATGNVDLVKALARCAKYWNPWSCALASIGNAEMHRVCIEAAKAEAHEARERKRRRTQS